MHVLAAVAQVASRVFRPSGKFKLGWEPKDRRVYYGTAVDGDERVLDEVRGRNTTSFVHAMMVQLHSQRCNRSYRQL
jgi:hypothetical protein